MTREVTQLPSGHVQPCLEAPGVYIRLSLRQWTTWPDNIGAKNQPSIQTLKDNSSLTENLVSIFSNLAYMAVAYRNTLLFGKFHFHG